MHAAHQMLQQLKHGKPVSGSTVQINCTEIVEIVAHAGYDFVMLDAEHGAMGIAELKQLITAADAAGIAPMVRVPDCTPSFISRVLDCGAAGIVVPNVRTADEAKAVVLASRYAPLGTRGACATTRAGKHWTANWAEFVAASNRDTLVWLLIEETRGLNAADDILAVAGIDAIGFGAFDMAQCLDVRGGITHPDVRAAFDRIRTSAEAHDVALMSITAAEPDGAEGAARRHARIVLDGFDAQVISSAFQQRMQSLVHAYPALMDRTDA